MEKRDMKTEKLTDRAFSRLMLTSILGILLCVACLCSTTFAWFTDSTPSEGNVVQMADGCLLTVTVTDGNSTVQTVAFGESREMTLEAGVAYTVTLSLPQDSASGYCLITAGGVTYRSDYILSHSESEAKTVSFILQAATAQTVVFTSRWGVYAAESSVQNGSLLLP